MVNTSRIIEESQQSEAMSSQLEQQQSSQQSSSEEPMQYDENSEAVNQRYEERCVNIDNMLNEEWQNELRQQREREEREAAEQAEQQQRQRDRHQRQQRKLQTLHTRHNVTVKIQRIMSDYMNCMLLHNRRIIEDLQSETLQNYTPNDNTYSPVRCRSPNLFSEDDDDNDNDADKGDAVINSIINAFDTYFDNGERDTDDEDDDEPAAVAEPAAEPAVESSPEPAVESSVAEPEPSNVSEPPVADTQSDSDNNSDDLDDIDEIEEYESKKQSYIRNFIDFFQKHQITVLSNYSPVTDVCVNVQFHIQHYTHDLSLMRSDWEKMFEFSGSDVTVDNLKLAHHYWNIIFDEIFTQVCNHNDLAKEKYDHIIKEIFMEVAAYNIVYNKNSYKIACEINSNISCILDHITMIVDCDEQQSESEDEDDDSEIESELQRLESELERSETPPPSIEATRAVTDAATTSIKAIRRQRRLALRRERTTDNSQTDSQTGYSPML
ncbi:ORF7 [Spodoptera eridania nucleopolyhedrovirus]|uniref:ORF7 n=1 Tax=Spodoptera eridania nucleopolyhedrovirus TaxID=2315721 RepID=A0A346TPU5_9ABAC|nr:ORF7 [Spodoptera eridania nucleopolyhedrovirus]AXU41605.1 ORF7 [Spodoptera eridania nucleopolyhedrovirus]